MIDTVSLKHWQNAQTSDLAAKWHPWLSDDGSLTTRLTQLAKGDFHVEILNEGWGKARADEHSALSVKPGDDVWIREVLLFGEDKPWVYARTVMNQAAINGELKEFTKVGTRPLGAILFNSDVCTRGPIDVALAELSSIDLPRPSRRSCFYYANHPIIVAESFLPAFEDAINSDN